MGKHATKRTVTAKKPKTKLRLPDLDHSKAAAFAGIEARVSACRR
jgi:hypothetical protein